MATETVVRSGRLVTLTTLPARGARTIHLMLRGDREPLCGKSLTLPAHVGTYLWDGTTRCVRCTRLAELIEARHIPA